MHFRTREAAVVMGFVALALVYTWPLAAGAPGRTLWGVDPMIDLYTVHWLASHAFDPQQLLGGNIFHPAPHAVLYSDLSLGTAVFLVPLAAVIRDPLPLYNAAVVVALAFAGWAFCTLTRALTGSLHAGLLAGVLAAFGSHQMYHLHHLNLLSTGWIALLLLSLHRLVEKPTGAFVILAGVSYAMTALSTGYYAVAAALLALVFAAWHARRFARASLLAAAAAALFAALLVAPYAVAFASLREGEPMRRPLEASAQMAFQPERDLPGSHGLLYGRLLGKGPEKSQRMFPGVLTPALALLALARRRRHAGLYAVAIGVLIVVSLGPGTPVYTWLFAIPPLDSMRHPYTFAGVAALLLAVLAGIGWASLRWAGRVGAAALALALAVAETLPRAPRFETYPEGVPPAYETLATLPPGPALELPVLNYQTLLWAARHGRPVLNGTGAFAPRATLRLKRATEAEWLLPAPADVDASQSAAQLAAMGARYVIVPSGRWKDVQPLAAAFDRSRTFRLAAVASDGDRIYSFDPSTIRSEPARGTTSRSTGRAGSGGR